LKSLTKVFPFSAFLFSFSENYNFLVLIKAPISTLDRHLIATSLSSSLVMDLTTLIKNTQQTGLIAAISVASVVSSTEKHRIAAALSVSFNRS
jgi:hypothetical protein